LSSEKKYVQVAVNAPLGVELLTYSYDDFEHENLTRGDLFTVPLGKRKSQGCIINPHVTLADVDEKFHSKIKSVGEKIENSFRLSEKELELYEWMAKYYHYPLGQLIFDCLPKFLKRPRAVEFIQGEGLDLPHQLNELQAGVFSKIEKRLDQGFQKSLIHGITGSGKTLVYLNLMKKVMEAGKSVHFLVPEINLTPQFTETFSKYLNCKILSYHSGISNSEKYQIWKTLNETEGPVLVMGVRSSIFLPLKNIGLIIVDEEHDQSFKQDSRCPYNARDVAAVKAKMHNANIVLGSATPTMENFYNYKAEENYFMMNQRAGEGELTKIEIVDTRDSFKNEEDYFSWPLTSSSVSSIREALEKGEQVLVFINKLGFANYIQCRGCGHHFTNENCGCGLNLRYFKSKNLLSCSHCEYKQPVPESCPKCGNIQLLQKGFGTERVQEVLSELLPGKSIERFDRDEIKNFNDLNDKLNRFHNHEIDVLVGTQMLSKGHNFEKVNLVVVLGIDSQMNHADFRALEKVYQQLAQVSGRAGRYSQNSKVLIQTLNPEHEVFEHLKQHHFSEFYDSELIMRKAAQCPPFNKMAMVYFSSRHRDKLIDEISRQAHMLKRVTENKLTHVRLLGPVPSVIEKKAHQFSWCFMLKSDDVGELHQLLQIFEKGYKPDHHISVKVDVDPYMTS
jgi:primosomal protein N' (replication factor Y)